MSVALLAALPQLIAAGLATEQQIAALINAAHPGMTVAEQATVLQFVMANSDKYIALLEKDKGPQVP
jgi:hypothetical protein